MAFVLVIYFVGWRSGVAVTTIPGYASQAECLAAVEAVETRSREKSGKDSYTAICVPGPNPPH